MPVAAPHMCSVDCAVLQRLFCSANLYTYLDTISFGNNGRYASPLRSYQFLVAITILVQLHPGLLFFIA